MPTVVVTVVDCDALPDSEFDTLVDDDVVSEIEALRETRVEVEIWAEADHAREAEGDEESEAVVVARDVIDPNAVSEAETGGELVDDLDTRVDPDAETDSDSRDAVDDIDG